MAQLTIKERVIQVYEILTGKSPEKKGYQDWFLKQIVRLTRVEYSATTIHRWMKGKENGGTKMDPVGHGVLAALEDEARAALKKRSEDIP
jgi:hypothetical protein